MKQRPYRFLISGGGTGGHIFPAISIANALKAKYKDAEILFVGADNRMEMEKIPAAGYKIVGLPVSGFDRSKVFNNFRVLWRLFKSLMMAKNVLREFKPDIAIGVGGYASGPTLYMAQRLGIPTLIQEQNSYAGVTNKLLAKGVRKICVAYPNMERYFPADKIVVTGNPVRKDLESLKEKSEEAYNFFNFSTRKKTLLVVGGSLGARTINKSVLEHLKSIDEAGIQLIWQTGKSYYNTAQEELKKLDLKSVWCSEFITRMDYAYSISDLVISRAGASSISELSLIGKPVILVPSPNVAEDHQTKNALALVQEKAAIMVTDKEAFEQLISTALKVISDSEVLKQLSVNVAKLAHRSSADLIVEQIDNIIQ